MEILKMSLKQKLEELFSKLMYKSSNNINCSICLQKKNEYILTLDCGHCFHIKCISEWEKRKDTCPYCRKKIVKKKHQIKFVISILFIISILILFLSFMSWTRTSSDLKKITKKVCDIFIKIFLYIIQIINLILEIIFMFLKGIFYTIIKICKNMIYILFELLKILYNINSLIIIIILSFLMLTIDIIIDSMNFLIYVVDILFKFI